jgi:putative endonuclease
MRDGDTVVFVEVRFRGSRRYGHPGETVGPRKRERLRRAAAHFLMCHPRLAAAPCRFDVVTVEPGSGSPQVCWFPHAFED